MGWMHNTRALLQRVAQARAAEEAAIERIAVSPSPDAPWPFEPIKTVVGEKAPNTESALRWLRVEAHRVGADAVLGVDIQMVTTLGLPAAGGTGSPGVDGIVCDPLYLASGTAVRKVAGI